MIVNDIYLKAEMQNKKMGLKIILVDDDPIVLMLHSVVIRQCKFSSQPLKFENGLHALNYLQSNYNLTDQHLVFLDINMPVMNGWDFLNSIQNIPLLKQIIVVIVSSSIDPADHKKAQQYPQVIDFLPKPFNKETCIRFKDMYDLHGIKDVTPNL